MKAAVDSAQVSEVWQLVHHLQGTDANKAQAAGRELVQFQKSQASIPVAAVLLSEAVGANDDAAAFFAAHTLATHSRVFRLTDGFGLWPSLAEQALTTLHGVASGQVRMSTPVLRQLCVALARLAVQLCDVWTDSLQNILKKLSISALNLAPLLEALQALAEEPFSRRLLVDGSHRSRFLLALRDQMAGIFATIGAACSACAVDGGTQVVTTLHCTTSWIRAQQNFEEWLPMISFSGSNAAGGSHPALRASSPIFSTIALRAARLEYGPEAFEAAACLLETALPLVGLSDLQQGARSECPVVQVLRTFVELCQRLPGGSHGVSALPCEVDVEHVVGVLLTVINAAFSSKDVLISDALRPDLLAAGSRLLVISGPSGGFELDGEGGTLGRCFDAWEAIITTHDGSMRENGACFAHASGPEGCPGSLAMQFGGSASSATIASDKIVDESFAALLTALPQALILPQNLHQAPNVVAVGNVRSRSARLLTLWCSSSDARMNATLGTIGALIGKVVPDAPDETSWKTTWSRGVSLAELELVLSLAASAAEAFAAVTDASCHPLPDPLARLAAALPSLPLSTVPAVWRGLLSIGAAEIVSALDNWITPNLFSPATEPGRSLLRFAYQLASVSVSRAAGAEAIGVVVSNLAPQIVALEGLADECCEALQQLCFGDSALSVASREVIISSAIGPLLSQLSDDQINSAVERFSVNLLSNAPPKCSEDVPVAEKVIAVRLLFKLYTAPTTKRADLPLEWIASHWQWFEAAVVGQAATESMVDAACSSLMSAVSKGRGTAAAREVILQSLTPLANAAKEKRSCAALNTLALLTRSFKGFCDDVAASQQMAKHVGDIVSRIIGPARNAEQQLPQLPPDLFAALLDLLTAALAPTKVSLALELFREQGLLMNVVVPVAAVLHTCANPKVVCWGLLLCERIPHWCQQSLSRPVAQPLFDTALPTVVGGCCQLLATSPLAEDVEVAETIAKLLIRYWRASTDATKAALASVCCLGIPEQELELLVQQFEDPLVTEFHLAESLRETAANWQVEHLRHHLARS